MRKKKFKYGMAKMVPFGHSSEDVGCVACRHARVEN